MALGNNPRILVFAGPNGSGKSTVTRCLNTVGLYINADDIKSRGGLGDLEAVQEAERLREFCLENRESFTFETVLSTDRNLELLHGARAAGYHIEGVFVLTADAELNVFRVKGRVLDGGHDVPADKIRSRYVKSLANLPEFAVLCDTCTVFDNTADSPKVIYRKDNKGEVISESQFWSKRDIERLVKRSS